MSLGRGDRWAFGYNFMRDGWVWLCKWVWSRLRVMWDQVYYNCCARVLVTGYLCWSMCMWKSRDTLGCLVVCCLWSRVFICEYTCDFVCYSFWSLQVLVGHNFPPHVPIRVTTQDRRGDPRGTHDTSRRLEYTSLEPTQGTSYWCSLRARELRMCGTCFPPFPPQSGLSRE